MCARSNPAPRPSRMLVPMRSVAMSIGVCLFVAGCALQSQGTGDDLAFGDAAGLDDGSVGGDLGAALDDGLGAADTSASDGSVPDTFAPDTSAPDTFAPDTLAPDTFAPDTAKPDTGPPCTEITGKLFAGHCYFTLTARDQPAAKSACAAAGAHLVTVGSSAEHDFLKTMGSGDRWIGLESKTPSNNRADYAWVTGEPKTFEQWYAADPDAMGPCAAMHGSLQAWVDRACSQSNAAICERE